jgi:hypothetical protein
MRKIRRIETKTSNGKGSKPFNKYLSKKLKSFYNENIQSDKRWAPRKHVVRYVEQRVK